MVKLHRHSGKVSYLVYDGLDGAHKPTLHVRIKVSLRTLAIEVFKHA